MLSERILNISFCACLSKTNLYSVVHRLQALIEQLSQGEKFHRMLPFPELKLVTAVSERARFQGGFYRSFSPHQLHAEFFQTS
jgi:hypothetical protein